MSGMRHYRYAIMPTKFIAIQEVIEFNLMHGQKRGTLLMYRHLPHGSYSFVCKSVNHCHRFYNSLGRPLGSLSKHLREIPHRQEG